MPRILIIDLMEAWNKTLWDACVIDDKRNETEVRSSLAVIQGSWHCLILEVSTDIRVASSSRNIETSCPASQTGQCAPATFKYKHPISYFREEQAYLFVRA
jgi:hypothetical protein